MRRVRIAFRALGVLLAAAAVMAPAAAAHARHSRARLHHARLHHARLHHGARVSRFQIRHVFVIVLENESEATSFGSASPAPYLARTMPAQGAFLPNYYGVGHSSLDNYIAMVSGQAPNPSTQADCGIYANFPAGSPGAHGQQPGSGCIYPAGIPSLASQLDGAGLSWRDYNESMGADPSREAAVCGHPPVGSPDNTEVATSTDTYATRHNPFMYFHSIIDNASLCDSHVVNLDRLPADLRRVSRTRDYTFITPGLCSDGHDTPCPAGGPGGLAQVNTFLQQWVPRITRSPAFRRDGLLLVTFDEAAGGDSSSCCGEIPGPASPLPGGTGPGGGQVGAVLLSPCIKPGTVSQTAYNHYTMLGSVENIFGLSHLGYADLPGETYFGTDIFKRQCGPSPPRARLHATIRRIGGGASARVMLRWSASTRGGTALSHYQLQERRGHRWHTLLRQTKRTSYTITGTLPHLWQLRVRAVNLAGQPSRWASKKIGAAAG